MHIAAFPLWATTNTSFGTDLEIIETHLVKGDEVTLFTCDADLPACDINWYHEPHECERCRRSSRHGLSLLSGRFNGIRLDDLPAWSQPTRSAEVKQFDNAEALKEWRVGAFDIGYAVLSSLISWKRHRDVPIQYYIDLLQRNAEASLRLYNAVNEWLSNSSIDRVYVYNGRFASMRAIVRACQERGVEVYTHDRGCDLRHYATYENALPHDRELFNRDMERSWASADSEEQEQRGAQWYLDRAGGDGGSWRSFVMDQVRGEMPENWDSVSGRKICIFTSSEHEFASIGAEWNHDLFETQLQGLKFITSGLRDAAKAGKLHFFIRIHPNQALGHPSEEGDIMALADEHVTIIPSASAISTYDLLAQCDTALSFGSTTGIEATFWGTPSVLAGVCFYRDRGGTYNPETREELISLLTRPLNPKDKNAAIKYGYYQATRGDPYRYYEPTGILTGKFKGVPLDVRQLLGFENRVFLLEHKVRSLLSKMRRKIADIRLRSVES